ncbi:MAG: hypothetical protein JXA96_11910 [Sedimentisphaerales bacterium]|nr:hypothetical protein [Sedimentisphaerales bacterium]
MQKRMFLMAIVLVGTIAGFAQGAGMGDMALENTVLRQRLDQLDREIQELRENSALQSNSTVTQVRQPVWSKLDIQLYGYLKLDMALDNSRINTGNFARWVDSERYNDNDEQFNMTANETRLGFIITGPKNNGLITSGKVEIDFYGTGAAENKAGIMMRHAFIKLDWPDYKFNIIAGQTSDVISPLVPTTVNYTVCWWTGNIGYRRPQIRLTKEFSFNDDVDLKLEGALARTIGRENFTSSVTWDTDSGEDAGFPTWQGRVSVSLPILTDKKSTIGLSAHVGEEEYDITQYGDHTDFETWSVNLDVTQPICDKLTLKGELFTGENLDSYLGGIGQGVNVDTTDPIYFEEISSQGGWIAASLEPCKNKNFNFGMAVDDVDRGEVNVGDRILNRTVFGNVICSLSPNTDIGLELSHWRTEYHGPGDGDGVRAQVALKYKF